MAKNNVADLLSVGSLFTTQAERDEAQRETVRDIPLEEISDFPNHPFKVRMDESMMEMVDSVKQYGVLVPALVRPKPDGGYEMIAGHRRRMASELAEKPTLLLFAKPADFHADRIDWTPPRGHGQQRQRLFQHLF